MPASAPPQVLDHARRLAKRGQLRPALDLIDHQLDQLPDDGRLWELRGILLGLHGEHGAARAALETASMLVSLSTAGQVAWADVYLALGQPQLALPLLDYLFVKHNLPDACLPRLASAFSKCNRHHRGLQVYRELVRRQPESDAAHAGLAEYMIRLDYAPERIVPVLEQAIALAPDRWRHRLALIQFLLDSGDLPAARATVRGLPPALVAGLSRRCCLESLYQACLQLEEYECCAALAQRLAASDLPSCPRV